MTKSEQKEKENKTNRQKTWQNKLLRNRPYGWKFILKRLTKNQFPLLFNEETIPRFFTPAFDKEDQRVSKYLSTLM